MTDEYGSDRYGHGMANERFDAMEQRIQTLEAEVKEGFRKNELAHQRLYENRTTEIQRLDHIEHVEIPAIKAHVGLAV